MLTAVVPASMFGSMLLDQVQHLCTTGSACPLGPVDGTCRLMAIATHIGMSECSSYAVRRRNVAPGRVRGAVTPPLGLTTKMMGPFGTSPSEWQSMRVGSRTGLASDDDGVERRQGMPLGDGRL